ncbi:MAG: hypothetical protein Kow0042_13150 [Calditrichia bacterium]
MGSPRGDPALRENPIYPFWGPLRKMYYAYILKSLKDGRYCYGSTSDLKKRLKSHNAGKVRSTKHRSPWELHYCEEFASKTEAIQREHFFKSLAGYAWLKNRGIILT